MQTTKQEVREPNGGKVSRKSVTKKRKTITRICLVCLVLFVVTAFIVGGLNTDKTIALEASKIIDEYGFQLDEARAIGVPWRQQPVSDNIYKTKPLDDDSSDDIVQRLHRACPTFKYTLTLWSEDHQRVEPDYEGVILENHSWEKVDTHGGTIRMVVFNANMKDSNYSNIEPRAMFATLKEENQSFLQRLNSYLPW